MEESELRLGQHVYVVNKALDCYSDWAGVACVIVGLRKRQGDAAVMIELEEIGTDGAYDGWNLEDIGTEKP